MDNLKTDVLKEPRGFIRVLQFIFSICAFATTTNFSSQFIYTVTCKSNATITHILKEGFSYPFKMDHIEREEQLCGQKFNFNYFGDYASDAEFFVATGVLAMIYALASLAFYCLFDAKYQAEKSIPLVDFLITVVMAVFWLSGSAAWASGVSSVKYVCDPANFFPSLAFCNGVGTCVSNFAGNFAGLNVSLIFGFLNFFLWAANLWFLYKETSWFQPPDASSAPPTGVQSPSK